MLSLILMNRPHIHVGAPKSHQALALPPSGSSSNLQDQVDVSALVLALQTLGNFDFEVCANCCMLGPWKCRTQHLIDCF